MRTVTRRTLFQSSHVVVVQQEYSTDTVYVTFNEMGMPARGHQFWGGTFFQKRAISSIGVMSTVPNWYPQEDMKAAVRHIREAVGNRRIITYGHSQGGYGALKYAGALHASASLAFCPQWSIDPADVGHFDTRFAAYHKRELQNGARIEQSDVCGNNYIFFDPHQPIDLLNAQILTKYPNTTPIIAPFTGHATIRTVAEGRIADDLIGLFMTESAARPATLRNLIRRARTSSRSYMAGRAFFLLGKAPRHSAAFRAAIVPLPDDQRLAYSVLISLSEKNVEEAAALMATIPDAYLCSFGLLRLWTLFRRFEFLSGELRVARLIIATYPGQPFYRLHAVNSFITAELFDEAGDELDRIVQVPGLLEYVNFAIVFSARLGRPEILDPLLADPAIPGPRRRAIGLEIAEACLRDGRRDLAYVAFDKLATAYGGAPIDPWLPSGNLLAIDELERPLAALG